MKNNNHDSGDAPRKLAKFLPLFPLALLSGWGVAIAAIVNFLIVGYVVYADGGNQFGLSAGDVVTVVGSYDDSVLVNSTGTVSLDADSGNKITFSVGDKTYTEANLDDQNAGYGSMTLVDGQIQSLSLATDLAIPEIVDSFGFSFSAYDNNFGLLSGDWEFGESFNGVLAGALSISSSGAATYNIPIELPPGIGGLTPQLSLNYNSQSGNGLLGVGWSLGGLSSIARCPATLAQDVLIDPVDLDSNDGYCLDGQRLIAVTNTGCSGGTEYRTEIDSYARICAYGTAGTGPAWFKVWTKAGQVMEYGNTQNSGIEAQGVASMLVWAVNHIEDAVGNYLDVSYFEDNANGEYRPDRIEYTGNASQGMTPYHSVQFSYESRNDVVTGYVNSNLLMRTSARLTNVKVYGGYSQVRDYHLTYAYGTNTGRSRIETLQRCDGEGVSAQCQPEMTLTWSTGSAAFAGAISTTRSNTGYQTAQPIDVNGDGRTDLAYCTSATANWQILISTGSGLNAPINTGKLCTNYQYSLPIDYNTDGKMDLLVPYANSRWYVLRANGSSSFDLVDTGIGSSGYTNKPVVMDINGDGRDDLALNYSSAWYLRINNGNGFNGAVATGIASTNWTYRLKIDYDGDGWDDLLVPYANSRWYVLRSTGSTLQLVDTGRSNTGYNTNPQVMDVDGDGRQDLVVNGSSTKLIYKNQGNALSAAVTTSVGVQWSTTTFQIDYNGDGKMDLIIPGAPGSATASNWYILQSTGSNFTSVNTAIASTGYNANPKPGDYNGDGFVDLALAYNSVWVLRQHGSGTADRLTSINDGLDGESVIAYKLLTDSSIYTSSTSTYPQMSVRAPVYVVSSVAVSNGVGGTNTQTYSYTGGRVDLLGRGFLGFQTITALDDQTQIKTKTTYSQVFPYVGMPESLVTQLASSTSSLKSVTHVLSNVQPYTGVYQVRNDSTSELTYELDSSLVSALVTENSLYDSFGSPGQVVVTLTGGGQTHAKTTISAYDNDIAEWHLGRLNSATVTSSTPSGVGTRASSFEYDPATGLLTAEIIEPDDPQLMLRTEYGYDGYGNRSSVTIQDSGSNAYPITTSTASTLFDYSQLAGTGTYTVTNTNAKGHAETQVIDARFGKPLSITGPNALTTQWEYDSFGRQIKEVRADGTSTQIAYTDCFMTNALFKITALTTGSVPVSVCYDRFGQELRSETVNMNGRVVFKDAQYNNLGQLVRTSRPYFANTTPQWTDYQYDALGRVYMETGSDGGIAETMYAGRTTTLQRSDVNGTYDQTVIRTVDLEGNLVQVIDEGSQVTGYEYDPFGNLTRVTDSENNATVMTYDRSGRKISMDDPDMGHWEYQYDALGQLRWQQDAKNQLVTMSYDVLGRMTSRVDPEGASTWNYDQPGSKGIGKLWKVAGPDGYSETATYDSLGRPTQAVHVLNGSTFTTTTSYDSLGRLDTLTYPSGFRLKHSYSSLGYLNMVSNADNANEVYWLAQETSADGQISSELLGNGLQTVRTIDTASGRMTYLGTYAGSTNVQMLTYQYDALGNLKSREDAVQSLSETFQYDNRNRLTQAEIAGVGIKTWSYDNLGNVIGKDGFTDYAYGSAGSKPHAVTAARGNTYTYDNNGNMTGGAGRSITWDSRNLPTRVTKGSATVDFSYAPDGSRYKQITVSGGVSRTFLYVGKLYEQVSKSGVVTHKNYIVAGGRVVAVRETVNSTVTMKYLHPDHLGSTDVVTGSSGQVLERQSFDAFGTRRVAATWAAPLTALSSQFTTRGFTGHEQLDDIGLIHMSGRVYDPGLGRFISADPIVQAPGNAQTLNRFSYTINNPLALTDPSGYFSWSDLNPVKWVNDIADWVNDKVIQPIGDTIGVSKNDVKKYVAPLVAVVVAPWAGFYIGTTYGLSTAAGYAVSGFTAGFVASGGDLQAGVVGAVTGVAFYGVETIYGSTWTPGRVFANSTVGGVSSELQGGSFEDGFKMNFATSALTYLNYSMRDAMVAQSKLMACTAETSCNSNGISNGLRGDGFKLAGARQLVDRLGNFLGLDECASWAGGCQGAGGQQANLAGFPYSPGGVIDRLAESFAGPHDWFRNLTGAYDANGNSVQYGRGYGLMQDYAMNYGLLVPAAPIAAAGFVAEYPGMQMMTGLTAGRW